MSDKPKNDEGTSNLVPFIYRDKLGYVWSKCLDSDEWNYLGYKSAKAWAKFRKTMLSKCKNRP